MIEDILKILRADSNQTFNARQLARKLNLDSGDHKTLRGHLKDLVTEGKVIFHPDDRYSIRNTNKVLKGRLKLHADGFGFFIPESSKKSDVFVPSRHINYAMDGDTVLVESSQNKKDDGRFEGRVIQILKRAHKILVGQVKKEGHKYFLRGVDSGAQVDVYLPQKSLGTATDGDLVSVRVIQYPGPGVQAVGEVEKTIGGDIDDKTLADAVLLKRNIERKFPKKVREQVDHIPNEVDTDAVPDRFDLRDVPLITIDGVTARDFDDAVCCVRRGKAYIVYVAIADVAEYVTANSALDEEAYRRGTSVYLPDECIPMLPHKLSQGLCSLNPHEPRFALVAELHYNDNFDFSRCHFYQALIASHKRATYQETQAFFDGTGDGNFEPDVQQSLRLLKEVAEELMKRAKKRGTLGFDLPEAEMIYDNHGEVQNIQRAQRFFSHKLIEMFMVAANVAVAQYFSVHGLPLLYRIHDRPDELKLQHFIEMVEQMGLGQKLKGFHPSDFFTDLHGHAYEQFLQSIFLRSLKQAVYDPANIGHYGLALEDYCHFTSPIRRYPDLIVHRQLKHLLKHTNDHQLMLKKSDFKRQNRSSKQKTWYDFSDLKAIGTQASRRERDAAEAEREITKIKQTAFVKKLMHEKFFGKVVYISRHGMAVELDPYFVEGFLPVAKLEDDYYLYDDKRLRFVGRRTKKVYKIGDRIWVAVDRVELEKMSVQLSLVENKRKTKSHKEKKRGKKKKRRGSK